ncbi:NUDIX hydrolase [Sulfitobacter sp. JB4-11]|uniref:NUDIX hydrolase n=1 Tax=Sulfitobacter rhodophyticola TaxID=3238304 RepID=UPI003D81BFE9
MIKQLPISLHGAAKSDVRTQFAALCYRVKRGKVQILLVTSRRTKRWIVPKGWPMEGRTPAASALQEAWEEGGVQGRNDGPCLGVYSYAKGRTETGELQCVAMLYPVAVIALAKRFPESGQRRRRWVSRKKAARLVAEPELAQLIRDFDPRPAKRRDTADPAT